MCSCQAKAATPHIQAVKRHALENIKPYNENYEKSKSKIFAYTIADYFLY